MQRNIRSLRTILPAAFLSMMLADSVRSADEAFTIGAAPSAVSAGQPIKFSVSASTFGKRVFAADWTFDDGARASGEIVDHTYSQAGLHTATVVLKVESGETASAKTTVTVEPVLLPQVQVRASTGGSSALTLADFKKLTVLPLTRLSLDVTALQPGFPTVVILATKGFSVTVPAKVVNGKVEFTVPPIIVKGKLKSLAVTVQISQNNGALKSNAASGLKVGAPPMMKAKPGVATLSFLNVVSDLNVALLNQFNGTLFSPDTLKSSLNAQAFSLSSLIGNIGHGDKFQVPGSDVFGADIEAAKKQLTATDRLILAAIIGAANVQARDGREFQTALSNWAAALIKGDEKKINAAAAAFEATMIAFVKLSAQPRDIDEFHDQARHLDAAGYAGAALSLPIEAESLLADPFGVKTGSLIVNDDSSALLAFDAIAAMGALLKGYERKVAFDELGKHSNPDSPDFVAAAHTDFIYGFNVAGSLVGDLRNAIDNAFDSSTIMLSPVTSDNTTDLFVYDAGVEDGDHIMVTINGSVVVSDERLTNAGRHIDVKKFLQIGPNTVVFTALNEGEPFGPDGVILRPNTAAIRIAGQLRAAGLNTGQSAMLTFIIPGANFRVRREAPQDANPQRTMLGVGEKVSFQASPAAKWKLTGGGSISSDQGEKTVFTAPFTDDSCTVTAMFDSGEKKDFMFTVIPPNDIAFTNIKSYTRSDLNAYFGAKSIGTGATDKKGVIDGIGAAMDLSLVIGPATVSFRNIRFLEMDVAASHPTGVFLNNPKILPNSHHPGKDPAPIGITNEIQATDTAAFSASKFPVALGGSYEFNIPLVYIPNDADTPTTFAMSKQSISIASGGVVTVSKKGPNSPAATVTRAPLDP